MAYEYEGRLDFRSDAAAVLERAKDLLSSKGFKVLPPAGNQLWFTNPVSYLNTKKQPLLMVSKGSITATGSSLALQAELGNLQALVKFLALLTGVLAIPETAMVAVILVMVAKLPALLPLCLLSIAPIPFVLLILPKIQGGITSRALDALLNEVAIAGDNESMTAAATKPYADGKTGKRYWFRARRRGWGWDLPITWEGWLVTAGVIAAAVGGEMVLPPNPLGASMAYMAVIVAVFLGICFLKGEPPGGR